jgi:hypothetical protein
MARRFLAASVALALMLSIAACSSEPIAAGQARMPSASGDFKDENYQDVEDYLHDAGFTNVETRPLGDLITGWLNHPGEVLDVEIDGIAAFDKGDVFAKDVKIVVSYHSFPEDVEEEEEPTESPSDEPSTDPGSDSGSDLAVRARTRFLEAWGVTTELDLFPYYQSDPLTPTYAIYKWEDIGGWVRVYVQEDITEEEAHLAGKQILGLTCDTVDLSGVVVQGIDGLDINVPKSEMPLCN